MRSYRFKAALHFVALFATLEITATAQVVEWSGNYSEQRFYDNELKNKSKTGTFSLSASNLKYGIRLFENGDRQDRGFIVVSDPESIYSSVTYETHETGQKFALGSIRPGRFINIRGWHKVQLISLAYLLVTDLSSVTKAGELQSTYIPELFTWRADFEKWQLRSELLKTPDGAFDKLNLWGIRPEKTVTKLENSKDCFLLGTLTVELSRRGMPEQITAKVYTKRPEVSGKMRSQLNRLYVFNGEIRDADSTEAFKAIAYDRNLRVRVKNFMPKGEAPDHSLGFTLEPTDPIPFLTEHPEKIAETIKLHEERRALANSISKRKRMVMLSILVLPIAFAATIWYRNKHNTNNVNSTNEN